MAVVLNLYSHIYPLASSVSRIFPQSTHISSLPQTANALAVKVLQLGRCRRKLGPKRGHGLFFFGEHDVHMR